MANNDLFSTLSEDSKNRILTVLKERVEKAINENQKLTWNSFLTTLKGFVNIASKNDEGKPGREYKGWINNFILGLTSMQFGGDPRFLTFNQVKTINKQGCVLRGSASTPIWKPVTKLVNKLSDDGCPIIIDGKEAMRPILIGWSVVYVFNVRQTNLIDIKAIPESWVKEKINKDVAPLSAIEDFFSLIEFNKEVSKGHPYYRPGTDTVGMPPFEQFHNNVAYSESLCHEMIHWTGSRLGRKMGELVSKVEYSYEELVACLGSAFLMDHLGVVIDETETLNISAYLKNWLEYLQNNIQHLMEAAMDASHAVNFLVKLANDGKVKKGQPKEDSEEVVVAA